MRIFTTFFSLSFIALSLNARSLPPAIVDAMVQQSAPQAGQLYAVRGEVVKIKSQDKGMLLITIRPAKDFAEVTILARENDLVGNAIGGAGSVDLLGLLSGDSRDEETITAAELAEGDLVSAIYDPHKQNRAIELYIH